MAYTGYLYRGCTLGGFTQGVQVRQQTTAGLQNTVTVFTQGLYRGCFYTRWFTQGVFTEGVHWVVLHWVSGLAGSCWPAKPSLSLHWASLQRVYTGWFTQGVFTLGGFTHGVVVRQQAAASLQNTVTVFTHGLYRGFLHEVVYTGCLHKRVYTGWFYTGCWG